MPSANVLHRIPDSKSALRITDIVRSQWDVEEQLVNLVWYLNKLSERSSGCGTARDTDTDGMFGRRDAAP
jgi:hypothetical protein